MEGESLLHSLEFRTSGIHGTGVFATRFIREGSEILEYCGERITKEESNRRLEAGNPFIFYWDVDWNIDGAVGWNPARFLNHSCEPNCEVQQRGNGIWVVAIKEIEVGGELTFNYGYDLEDYEEYQCRCGSPNCVGYMVAEEFFDEVRQGNED